MKKKSELAPVVIFAFNRPHHLKKTLEYLCLNDLSINSSLYVYVDGPRNNQDKASIVEIKNILNNLTGFKNIIKIFRESNIGLKANIEKSITEIFNQYNKAIFLEDDIITGKSFLNYMNSALNYYESFKEICQVSGYSYLEELLLNNYNEDVYFIKGGDCLAWGTWKDRWESYDQNSKKHYFDIKTQKLDHAFDRGNTYPFLKMLKNNITSNKSWAINWYAINFLRNKFTVYPVKSLALHIGADNDATNYKKTSNNKDPLEVNFYSNNLNINLSSPYLDNTIEKKYTIFLNKYNKKMRNRIKNKVKSIYKLILKHKIFYLYKIRLFMFKINYNLNTLTFKSNIENDGFKNMIKSCTSYLGFGTGSSTIYVDKSNVKKIICIEGDYKFYKYVKSKVIKSDLIYRNIGQTTLFSDPYISILFPLNHKRIEKFKLYSEFPKNHYNESNLPDLVLIDGNFRVACALKTLKYFMENDFNNWKIIIDDYVGRSQYNILEYFFKNINLNGEQAIFSGINDFEKAFLEDTINKYELIID